MWSILDRQTGRVLTSGRNRDSKDEALEGAFDFWSGPQAEFTEEEVEELRENKEEWLISLGFVPFEHDEPL